jgi:Zn-dependent protease
MTTTAPRPQADVARRTHPAFSIAIGLTSLAILLQGVWAGLFIREGKDNNAQWVEVHDWGARVAIVLAAVATVIAIARLRHRKDLVVGSAALTVLLFVEAYIGGEVGDTPGLQVVHFPLALALLGLAVWLPVRARTRSGAGHR